jgi:hypothetical protein
MRPIDADMLKRILTELRDRYDYYGDDYQYASYKMCDVIIDEIDEIPTLLEIE